jgi:hypothetical protein
VQGPAQLGVEGLVVEVDDAEDVDVLAESGAQDVVGRSGGGLGGRGGPGSGVGLGAGLGSGHSAVSRVMCPMQGSASYSARSRGSVVHLADEAGEPLAGGVGDVLVEGARPGADVEDPRHRGVVEGAEAQGVGQSGCDVGAVVALA